MKIVIAPDSFKGSLTAGEVCDIIERAVLAEGPCGIVKLPVADGGEGTLDAVAGEYFSLQVTDPLGRPVIARYGAAGETAVIEMSLASGILLLKPEERNPLITTTYGTGEMILDAVKRGYQSIILGIGSSATNDGGVGMAQALGARFCDARGREIGFGGEQLARIETIDLSGLTPLLKGVRITAACDVENPLCRENGAAEVYARQKGADDEGVRILDDALRHLAVKIREQLGIDVAERRGAGAAGGLGAGLIAFLGASLEPGFETVAKAVRLEEAIAGSDLVITGEGRTDFQTAFGKLPCGVGRIARKYGVPCVVISGAVEGDVSALYDEGITAVFPCVSSVMPLREAMRGAPEYLYRCARNVIRLYRQNATGRL